MSTLILHIGTEKTGTTSIQKFLKINQSRLEDSSIFTSGSLSVADDHLNHRWLTYGVMDKGKFCNDGYLRRINLSNNDEIELQFNQRMERLVFDVQRSRELKGNPLWILSSEHLQSRLRQDQEIKRLRDVLIPHFDAIILVAYIRRPIDLAVSLLSQQLKNGQRPSTVLECDHPYIRNLCDHETMIKKWSRAFNPENIVIRRFQRENLKNNDVIHDFLAIVGIESLDEFTMPEMSNQRLSGNAMKYLWHLNKRFPAFVDNHYNYKRDGLVDCILECFCEDRQILPPFPIRESYEKYYSSSEKWVIENFFPGETRLWTSRDLIDKEVSNLEFTESGIDKGALKMIEKLWSERH